MIDIRGRQAVGVVAVGHGIQISSGPDGGEKRIVTIEFVTGKDVVSGLQMSDNQPVVSGYCSRRISS